MNSEYMNSRELLQQFQISDKDLQLIRDFGALPQVEVDNLIREFYVWLEDQVWYNQYFSEGVPPRVQSLQSDYWRDFLEAKVNDAYVKQRVTVGRVHATINLPVTAYLAGMNFAQCWFSDLAKENTKKSDDCIELLGAINRLIQLDSNIVMHVYSSQSMEAVRRQGELTNKIVNEATRVVRLAAAGEFETIYVKQDESDVLDEPINRMVESLKSFSEETEKEKWLKSGVADLALAMRGGLATETLSDNVIRFLAQYLDSQVGVFYVADRKGAVTLNASYAFTRRKNLDTKIQPGQGLVGQVLREGKPILLSNIPDDYITVNSGLGERVPRNVIVQPLIYEENVKGVVELGSFREFTDEQLEFLNQVSESIAVAINLSLDQEKMQNLLQEAQQTSEKLQFQQEELETANQTLEEQAQALKQSEEELTSQRDMLEESNKELQQKTFDLEKQKSEIENARMELQEKADQLANSSKYKSEFLANMSHELRTPLNALLLLSQSLITNKEGNLNEDQIEDLAVIHDGGSALLTLINDILDLSKVESGKMQAIEEHVDIQQLTKKLLNQFNPVAEEKRIEFSVEIDFSPDRFRTDAQRLEQILRNLLSNAFKFTHKGQVCVRVYKPDAETYFTHSELNPENSIAFSVSDTGVGISKNKQGAIFEAFQQADGSTSRAYGGTGLGLTISRELAKLLGGEIQLQSTEGNGSCFTLILPKLIPGNSEAGVTTTVESIQVPSEHRDKQANLTDQPDALGDTTENYILIVEDDSHFGEILSKMAEERGFKPLLVSDGVEALKLVLSHSPKAVILDMGLPDTDGLKVLESLKASPQTREIPVHIISSEDTDLETLRKGALGFLTKPASMDDLDNIFSKFETLIQKNIKQILLVEDDPATSKATRQYLEKKDIEVHTAESGELALQRLQQQRIDCCILDLSLEDMNGFEFLKAVELAPNLKMPPTVVYTAKELSEEDYKELRAYTDKIVIKDGQAPERLNEEVDLFLHSVQEKLPPSIDGGYDRKEHIDTEILQGRKVLLVDDDLRNVYALSKILKEHGLNVMLADNGKLAFEKLQKEKEVDLVLMDIMMPVMDGYDAMKKIREEISTSIPIIALTAKAMTSDREKCLQAGANDYMSKPVDVNNLLSMLKVWCYH